MVNANAYAGDVVIKGLEVVGLVVGSRIFDVAGGAIFNQQGLENVGDLIGQAAGGGQLSVKKRDPLMNLLPQIFIGEPDEVGEVRGEKFVGVGDLKYKIGAG